MGNRPRWTPLVGRILVCLIFLLGGLMKLFHWSDMAALFASKHIPVVPVALAIVIIIEILGGLSVLTGFLARFSAWVMFLYLIPVSLIMHNFWVYQGAEREDQMIHFMKNLAIMGGLLILAAFGPGSLRVGAGKESGAGQAS